MLQNIFKQVINKFIGDINKLDYNSKPFYESLRKYLVDAKDIIVKFSNLATKMPPTALVQGNNINNNTIFTDGQIQLLNASFSKISIETLQEN